MSGEVLLTCLIASNNKYLIIGQGLAGSILSCMFEEAGIDFMCADMPGFSKCSLVAAGVYNPISLKRMIFTEKAELALPVAEEFYRKQELLSGMTMFHEVPMVKFFGEEQEKKHWLEKAHSLLKGYISDEILTNAYGPGFKHQHGYAKIVRAGYLNVLAFLAATNQRLQKQERLLGGVFDHRTLQVEQKIKWRGIQFDKVVFCEGHLIRKNPRFSFVEMKPVKGEILQVKIPGLNLFEIINKGVYIVPLGSDLYKVGSTYEWEDLSEKPTQEARQKLEKQLGEILDLPFEVLDQDAGIRPAVIDRRPVIGTHPDDPRMAVFNGLGTRGVMLGPYYAKMLIDHLVQNKPIDKFVDVNRFYRKE